MLKVFGAIYGICSLDTHQMTKKDYSLFQTKLKPSNSNPGACLATSDLVMDYCPLSVAGYHFT